MGASLPYTMETERQKKARVRTPDTDANAAPQFHPIHPSIHLSWRHAEASLDIYVTAQNDRTRGRGGRVK